jgi:hypothetical protein
LKSQSTTAQALLTLARGDSGWVRRYTFGFNGSRKPSVAVADVSLSKKDFQPVEQGA